MMAILERELDGGAVALNVRDGAFGEMLGGGGNEDAVDPHGCTSLRNEMRVLLGVAGRADCDEKNVLHELARGDVTHGGNTDLVEVAIGAEEAVVAAVLRRNTHLPESTLGVDGRAEAIFTLDVREVVRDVAEIDLADVAVVLDEDVGIVGRANDANAPFRFLDDAEEIGECLARAVFRSGFDDAMGEQRVDG